MSDFQGFINHYQKELSEERERLVRVLVTGNIVSFEEYKYIVGKLWGIERSLERHKELVALMENYDDERTSRK